MEMQEHPAAGVTLRRYASILQVAARIGLVLLLVTFVLYASGAVSPHVAISDLPSTWSLRSSEYIQQTGGYTGWQWIRALHCSDALNMAAIAVLAGVSMLCLVCVVPVLARNHDRIYLLLVLIQIAVLILAASGIFTRGPAT
jgi:hypothetical protein